MTVSFTTANFWLFDPLLMTSHLHQFDAETSTTRISGGKSNRHASGRGREQTREHDIYGLLNDALATLKIERGENQPPEHPRRKMGWFPILNPLLHFNGDSSKLNKSPLTGIFKALTLQAEAGLNDTSVLENAIQASQGFADFERITGKSLNQYISLYSQSANSHFSRFTKFLRRKHLASSPAQELLLYLSHPLFREEARDRFLEGKNLPLLEVDILHSWAGAYRVALPCPVASSVSAAEGEVDGTSINMARADGKRLTRQQIIDQAKALLPAVLDAISRLDLEHRHQHQNTKDAFHHLCALFALASLHRDVEVMTLPDAFEPGISLALRRLSVQDTSRTDDVDLNLIVFTHFRIFLVNGGFYPGDKATGDGMVEQLCASEAEMEADRCLPPLGSKAAPIFKFSHAQEIRDSASHLYNVQALTRYEPDHCEHDVGTVLSQHAQRISRLMAELEASRLEAACRYVDKLVGEDCAVPLPATSDIEEKLREHGALHFASLISNQSAMGQTAVPILTVLESALRKFVVNAETEERLENDVLPAILAANQRIGHFLAEADRLRQQGHQPMLVSGETRGLEASSSSKEKRLAIDTMTRLAFEHRFLVGQGKHYAKAIDCEGGQYQQRVNDALASLQSASVEGGNAFRALDELMATIDQTRAEYSAWATQMTNELALFALKASHLFLDVSVVPLPVADAAPLDCNSRSDKTPGEHEVMQQQLSEELSNTANQLEAEKAKNAALEAERDRLQLLADQATAEAQSLSHHLIKAERSRVASEDTDTLASLSSALIDFTASQTPFNALKVANAMFPSQLIFLETAYESARKAKDNVGPAVLRRLLLLGKEGLALMKSGRPLYELNALLPGEVACQESETCMSDARLRSQRTFKEHCVNAETKDWVMTAHNRISYDHRLYFEYDHQRSAFVIGYVGPHLEIASA